jgi:lysophospholipase L1-like esterase
VASVRYVAIGDSFTEGVGDDLPDGRVRGWADLVAQGWADATAAPVEYANIAIRGKLAWPIVDEQLEPALALSRRTCRSTAAAIDMIRPRPRSRTSWRRSAA